MNRHTHTAATKTRRAENEGRGRHTHTLPTHYGRAATAGAREADGARPTQFERDRTAEVQGLVIDCDLSEPSPFPF